MGREVGRGKEEWKKGKRKNEKRIKNWKQRICK